LVDTHGLDVSGEVLLLGMHKIGRQQQEAIGASAFGGDCDLLCDGGAIAGSSENGGAALGFVHGDGDDLGDFGRRQRKELAGSARCEQPGDIITAEPVHVRTVSLRVVS
jgi:hypothetical protein